MQVRPITAEEVERYGKIDQDAFVASDEDTQRYLERDVRSKLENTRALFNDEGEMLAILNLIFPRLWLGRESVPMPGVLGVASPPETRRQGYVKRLFEVVLEELYEKGYNICTLYPFYFPFYKKFGFEQVSTGKLVTTKIEQFQKFKPRTKGRWKEVTPDHWPEFNAIWQKFSQGKFGLLTREEESWWQGRLFMAEGNKLRKLYLWYDEEGKAQAYVTYALTGQDDQEGRTMRVQRAWTSPAAYHEILAFIANHDAQATKVYWYAAPDEEFFALVDNPRQVEEKLVPGYMLRILDAKRALEERPWSNEVEGSFSIALRDELMPRNNLALRVEVAGGRAVTEVLSDAQRAGLACDMRQLAQLYAGHLSPRKLAAIGLLDGWDEGDLAAAQRVFSPPDQPASHMPDFF